MIKGPSFDVLHFQPESTTEVHASARPIQCTSVFYVQPLLGCLLGRRYHGSRIFTFQRKRPRCCSCDGGTTWNSFPEGKCCVWCLLPVCREDKWQKFKSKLSQDTRVIEDTANRWTESLKYRLNLRHGGDGDRWQRLQSTRVAQQSRVVAAPSWGSCLEQHKPRRPHLFSIKFNLGVNQRIYAGGHWLSCWCVLMCIHAEKLGPTCWRDKTSSYSQRLNNYLK